MNKISKHLISLAILALLVAPVLVLTAHAQDDTFGLTNVNTGLGGSLSQADPKAVVTRIINIALGFLGLIALCIILYGGFKWMTAGGNEEKTEEAKKVLGAGVIGLIIILASWAIASYVITTLNSQLTNG
jgi:hypothetical protein